MPPSSVPAEPPRANPPRTNPAEKRERDRRGRPAEINPALLAATAMQLFTERGFDNVTMDEIAAAAGTSRRSIFRYFPSKSHLVWGGVGDASDRFHRTVDRGVQQTGSSMDAAQLIRDAFVQTAAFEPEQVEVTRQRLLIIQNNPALLSFGLESLGDLRTGIAEFVLQHTSIADSFRAQLIAEVIASAGFSALVWWAGNSDEDPTVVMGRAMDLLEKGILNF